MKDSEPWYLMEQETARGLAPNSVFGVVSRRDLEGNLNLKLGSRGKE